MAGVYQFTPLKYHCLDKCRAPLGFIMGHWRGRRERLQALRLGLHHGLFCVGCCWSLMLLMFAVGVGSLGWMLALGRGDGGREEPALGPPAERAARHGARRRGVAGGRAAFALTGAGLTEPGVEVPRLLTAAGPTP